MMKDEQNAGPGGEVDEMGKRKFFPRVKHLIGNKVNYKNETTDVN
jgi:hypothetical protein